MAGLLKLALGLHASATAPNAQLRALNLHIERTLRGVVCALLVQLAATMIGIGGVSSFGYSGTIAHSVLHYARSDGTTPAAVPQT